jgi:hypothetical protein
MVVFLAVFEMAAIFQNAFESSRLNAYNHEDSNQRHLGPFMLKDFTSLGHDFSI